MQSEEMKLEGGGGGAGQQPYHKGLCVPTKGVRADLVGKWGIAEVFEQGLFGSALFLRTSVGSLPSLRS